MTYTAVFFCACLGAAMGLGLVALPAPARRGRRAYVHQRLNNPLHGSELPHD